MIFKNVKSSYLSEYFVINTAVYFMFIYVNVFGRVNLLFFMFMLITLWPCTICYKITSFIIYVIALFFFHGVDGWGK